MPSCCFEGPDAAQSRRQQRTTPAAATAMAIYGLSNHQIGNSELRKLIIAVLITFLRPEADGPRCSILRFRPAAPSFHATAYESSATPTIRVGAQQQRLSRIPYERLNTIETTVAGDIFELHLRFSTRFGPHLVRGRRHQPLPERGQDKSNDVGEDQNEKRRDEKAYQKPTMLRIEAHKGRRRRHESCDQDTTRFERTAHRTLTETTAELQYPPERRQMH